MAGGCTTTASIARFGAIAALELFQRRRGRAENVIRDKTVRHRLLHIAGRTTPIGRRLDLDRTWPWTSTLLQALAQLRHAFAALTVTEPGPAHRAL
jgi:hypothetical protein